MREQILKALKGASRQNPMRLDDLLCCLGDDEEAAECELIKLYNTSQVQASQINNGGSAHMVLWPAAINNRSAA